MNTEVAIQLFGIFFVLMAIGAPIYLALGTSSLAIILLHGLVPLSAVPNLMQATMASFTLLAIPFFVLAGNLLAGSQVTTRLVDFALAVVGPVRGSLGVVGALAGFLFGGVSGSGPAATAALGATLQPRMRKAGYDPGFAGAFMAACGGIGAIVPPSIVIIIYGAVAEVSIGQLFTAAIIPGLLAAALLAVASVWVMRNRVERLEPEPVAAGVPVSQHQGRESDIGGRTVLADSADDSAGTAPDDAQSVSQRRPRRLWYHCRRAGWALMAPVIVLGGIYGGVFTPTEAAAVVVFYALFAGMVVYRDLTARRLFEILGESARTTGAIMLIIATASLFGFILNTQGIARAGAEVLADIAPNALITLLIINLIVVIAGCFLDGVSALYILVPVLLPAATVFDIDPVHLGIVLTTNLAVGMITPPVGVNLYVAAAVGGVPVANVMSRLAPILITQFAALALITCIPQLSLWLPGVLGMR